MPEVKSGESRESYMKRCVPIVMKEGLDSKAAVGKCEGMFNSAQKSSPNVIGVLKNAEQKLIIRTSMIRLRDMIAKAEVEEAIEQYSPELEEVSKAVTVGGYKSPEPGDLPEGGKKTLAEVYSKCRKDGGDKEKCAKIAWSATHNAGYKSESSIMVLKKIEKSLILFRDVLIENAYYVEKARKLSRKIKFQGMYISIETDKNEIRSGTDSNGKEWKTKMPVPYGYIRRTEGVDGDHVDCFIGNDPNCKDVWIVKIQNPDTKVYDEDKVFLGFKDEQEVMNTFYKSYDRKEFFQSIDKTDIDDLKKRMEERKGLKLKPGKNRIGDMEVEKSKALEPGAKERIQKAVDHINSIFQKAMNVENKS